MTTLVLEKEPAVKNVKSTNEKLFIDLEDGRTIILPIEWYPRLLHGNEKERENWRLLGNGYAIEWPDLDEHIGIEGLLAGKSSGESKKSFENWLEKRKTNKK